MKMLQEGDVLMSNEFMYDIDDSKGIIISNFIDGTTLVSTDEFIASKYSFYVISYEYDSRVSSLPVWYVIDTRAGSSSVIAAPQSGSRKVTPKAPEEVKVLWVPDAPMKALEIRQTKWHESGMPERVYLMRQEMRVSGTSSTLMEGVL